MKTFVGLTLLASFAFLASGPRSGAQQPKGSQKWEYATLNYSENETGSFAAWINPKDRFTAKSKARHHESLTKINKDLGGKEDVGIFDVCILLTRIGQDGWELVTHTKTMDRGTQIFTWTFKRPAAPKDKGERQAK
jgi:hypothetical protein